MDQGLNLSQNIDTLFNNIEKYTKTEGVIGKAVTHEDKTFIPVVSVSVGVVVEIPLLKCHKVTHQLINKWDQIIWQGCTRTWR